MSTPYFADYLSIREDPDEPGGAVVSVDGHGQGVLASERQAAAQALAGDEYRVVPVDRIDALSTDGRVRLYPSQPDRDEFPRVQGKCPTCGVGPLFLGEGGYVTCSWVDCKEPSAASELLHGVLPGEPIPEWERELLSQPRPEQPDRPAPVDPASVAKVKAEALREAARDASPDVGQSIREWLRLRADRLEQPDPQLVEALYQKLYETHNGGGDGSPPDERWNETYRQIAVRLARAGVVVPDA